METELTKQEETFSLEALSKVHGKVLPVLLPSRDIIVIREQNGEDDAVLSKSKNTFNGSAITQFLRGIIVYHSRYPGIVLKDDMVWAMPVRDRFYTLITSRIFSIGEKVEFKYKWPDDKIQTSYEDDLSVYVPDLNKELPTEDSEDYFPYRIEGYKEDAYKPHTFAISTGKVLSFVYTTGNAEKYLMNIADGDKTKNHELFARKLALSNPEKTAFTPIQNFKTFTAREMSEIRSEIEKFDPSVELLTEIVNPIDESQRVMYPIVASTDFFFPLGI